MVTSIVCRVGIFRPSLVELVSENELDEGAASHVTYKIFSLMPGIFRPGAALEAAVRSEASVRNSILSQVSVLSSCHSPPTESRGTVFYLTSIKARAPLTPLPAPSHPSGLPPPRPRERKLEEKRIRMGNLPVIPRTAAKRAICLINSLLCSARRLALIHLPVRASDVRPRSSREERLKKLRGAIKKTLA